MIKSKILHPVPKTGQSLKPEDINTRHHEHHILTIIRNMPMCLHVLFHFERESIYINDFFRVKPVPVAPSPFSTTMTPCSSKPVVRPAYLMHYCEYNKMQIITEIIICVN